MGSKVWNMLQNSNLAKKCLSSSFRCSITHQIHLMSSKNMIQDRISQGVLFTEWGGFAPSPTMAHQSWKCLQPPTPCDATWNWVAHPIASSNQSLPPLSQSCWPSHGTSPGNGCRSTFLTVSFIPFPYLFSFCMCAPSFGPAAMHVCMRHGMPWPKPSGPV